MYTDYIKSVQIIGDNLKNFKSNSEYNSILEHVSYSLGVEYLSLIENEFNISSKNIKEFIKINDKIGNPKKLAFTLTNNDFIICSPSSLRYIYHALIILNYFKTKNNISIVELGCGYGGLFLAICYFSKLLNIEIQNYYLIDLPDIGILINNYLTENKPYININYHIHDASNYGKDIYDNNLFFISNYCFTEIEEKNRQEYILQLFPKISSGFIIWQTIFGLPIENVNIIQKKIININEEKPQTANNEYKNYFVYI